MIISLRVLACLVEFLKVSHDNLRNPLSISTCYCSLNNEDVISNKDRKR